jgi:hypothetical protein
MFRSNPCGFSHIRVRQSKGPRAAAQVGGRGGIARGASGARRSGLRCAPASTRSRASTRNMPLACFGRTHVGSHTSTSAKAKGPVRGPWLWRKGCPAKRGLWRTIAVLSWPTKALIYLDKVDHKVSG